MSQQVVDELDVTAEVPIINGDPLEWGIKLNSVILSKIQPKINEIIENALLNNDVYGGSASSVYLEYQSLNGGGA
jgi:hypothetical protein